MTCADLRRYLSAFLDSELDGGTTAEVGAHLDACPDCAERVEAETRLERAICERLGAEPVRDCFWDECRERLGRRGLGRRWVALAWAASVLVAVAGGFALGHAPAAGAAQSGARELIAVLRERGREAQHGIPAALHEYQAVESSARAQDLLGRFVGDANRRLVHLDPGATGHGTRLVGYGTTFVGGEEVPVLHYRCCGQDLCVFFVMPVALSHFPGVARVLADGRGLTCAACPTTNVALRVCPKSGTVIAAVGSGCAPGLAGAIAEP